MVNSRFILAAVGLMGLASAHPINEVKPGSFSVTQKRNPNYNNSTFVPKAALAVYKTYMKYGKPVPATIAQIVSDYRAAKVAKRATSGSATNEPVDGDEEWITPVSIGTPAQVLNLDFDSGSSDLWVFSSLTPASEQDGQTLYAPAKSSTAKLLSGYTWEISYGDGSSSSGLVYDDVVTIGGVSFASQAVEVAEKVSTEFTSDTYSDGLLGLAFSTLNTVSPTAQLTFFDNIKSTLALPLWTADLKHNAAGTYTFGAIDSTYAGQITYTTVSTTQGYWTFDIAGYAIGTAAKVTTTLAGICDTGTTLLYLPIAIVEKYYASVSSAVYSELEGGYLFLCSATIPAFSFYVGTLEITIPATYLNYGALTAAGTYCLGALQPNTGIGLNIFGDIAIKSAFVVFDHAATGTPYLGWAKKTLS
ncbi:aspartic peptidase domain-containing protein [Xylariales sp. PMI_506]|nr:aspartic peptidase domain-containing protein [Xylariales sp. PMI_506]